MREEPQSLWTARLCATRWGEPMNRMRRILFVGSFLVAVTTALGAQQNHVAAAQTAVLAMHPAQKDFLPAGPFLFAAGRDPPDVHGRLPGGPTVKSPDGKAQITVTGPAESDEA